MAPSTKVCCGIKDQGKHLIYINDTRALSYRVESTDMLLADRMWLGNPYSRHMFAIASTDLTTGEK